MQGRREHTEDMKIQAKQTDIMDVAAYIGYTITKVGRHYSLKEHDSVVFYNVLARKPMVFRPWDEWR